MRELDLTQAQWRKSSRSGGNGACVEVAHVRAQWHKSSRSSANGACVEVAHVRAQWHKSSYSSGNGQCVEAAYLPEAIAVRDSKDPGGPILLVSAQEWRSFTRRLKSKEFG